MSGRPTKPRVYCPACGEVRREGYTRYAKTGTGAVHPHSRAVGDGRPEVCVGGKISLERDRAT